MKKTLIFTCFSLSCGLLLSDISVTKAESVTSVENISKGDAQKKTEKYVKGVSRYTYENWKNAIITEGKILYDLNGIISGYVFQIQKDNIDMGYVIASNKKGKNSIIESTREGTSPYKDIEDREAIYTGPLQHYKMDGNKITDLRNNQSFELKDIKRSEEKKRNVAKPFANSSIIDEDNFDFQEKYIQNVPDYTWYRGCTPTAFANVVGYWDQNGYGNLIKDNENTKQIIDLIGDDMDTDRGTGEFTAGVKFGTWPSKMAPGIKKYFNSRGYNPEVVYDETPTYEEYKKELDAERPIIIGLRNNSIYSDHTITGVGYESMYIPEINEDYKDLIVHDTWDTTPVDVRINYNQNRNSIESFITLTPFTFKDVPRSHWAYSEISYMVQKKIMNGYGNEYFGPADNVTREQLAAFLYRTLKPADTNENPFTDIKGNSFEKEIKALTKMGIFSVDQERKFNPKDTATRAQIATVLTKAFNLKAKANYEFNDMKGHWANE
uniref:S-layer homology domain-containing protein n=1 Tax=Bacillus thuringiensis TaxID=1428 RepID=UPI0020CF8721